MAKMYKNRRRLAEPVQAGYDTTNGSHPPPQTRLFFATTTNDHRVVIDASQNHRCRHSDRAKHPIVTA